MLDEKASKKSLVYDFKKKNVFSIFLALCIKPESARYFTLLKPLLSPIKSIGCEAARLTGVSFTSALGGKDVRFGL